MLIYMNEFAHKMLWKNIPQVYFLKWWHFRLLSFLFLLFLFSKFSATNIDYPNNLRNEKNPLFS